MGSRIKVPAEVAIIPIEEELIIAEREIIRRYSEQTENAKIYNISDDLPPYTKKIRRYSDQVDNAKVYTISDDFKRELPPYYTEKDPAHTKHYEHTKHHAHSKHHKHVKHHKPHGPNKHKFGKEPEKLDHKHTEDSQIFYDKHGHMKKHSKFKGRGKNEKLDRDGPKDKFHFVRIMFFILGIVHFLPFTFFSTANEYWMYKFRNTTIINSTDANDRTFLQTNFQSLSHMITMGPSTVCQILLTFLGHKITAKTRIFITLCLQSLIFLVQTSFVEINTDDWQVGFFIITVCAMTLVSCSTSFGSTGNMVTISQFPDQYLRIYMLGEGVASLVTSTMRLISIVSSPTTVQSALIYFVTGSFLMIVPTILFYFSTKLKFYRYYTRNIKKSTRKRIPGFQEFKEIVSYLWPLLLLHILTTQIANTSIINLVVSENYGTESVWGNKYFVTCCTYLLPAMCGILGRTLFYKFEINPSIKAIWIVNLTLQVVFIPLILFVNAKPRNHLPVLFPHDWQYALIVGSHSLISGYTSNMGQMKVLRIIPKDKLELSILVNFLVFKILNVATSPMSIIIVNLL